MFTNGCAELMGATSGSSSPSVPKNVPPVEAKFSRLFNTELAKPYIGKRVRTNAALGSLLPNSGDAGRMGAMMYVASSSGTGFECDASKLAYGQGTLWVLAPTSVGAAWAEAKRGTVFEMVGVMEDDESSGHILNVESMTVVGACP